MRTLDPIVRKWLTQVIKKHSELVMYVQSILFANIFSICHVCVWCMCIYIYIYIMLAVFTCERINDLQFSSVPGCKTYY